MVATYSLEGNPKQSYTFLSQLKGVNTAQDGTVT